MNIKRFIPVVNNWPKPGVNFLDVSKLLQTPWAFSEIVEWISVTAEEQGITSLVAVESRGFIFAAPVAERLGLPMILVRKKGKLPGAVHSISYDTEYSTDTLEIQQDAPVGTNPAIIDDLLATGGTVLAVNGLIMREWPKTTTSAIVPINLTFLPGAKRCQDHGIQLFTHTNYDS